MNYFEIKSPDRFSPTSPQEDLSCAARTEDAEEAISPGLVGASPSSQHAALNARQRSLLNLVSKEQQKWKGTVQEQRKNIYDRHSMLN